MKLAEDLWLRGRAAQASMMQLFAYNTAFAGTATLQAWKLGLSAPVGFWTAVGRAGGAANEGVAIPAPSLAPAASPARPRRAKAATPPKSGRATKPRPPAAPEPVLAPVPDPVDLGPSPHLLDAPRGGMADDLTALKGVGAKLAASLNEFGIYHFDQIANLDDEGIAWLNEQQNGFKMIAARYDLVGQARAKAAT
ncbi:hypothetical protein N8I71_17340 [Roseibacterium sp. SDUM158016]|uniref:hypothetical protein n=1 Tax=Roseicyclus sediminis TaxID=2980997 RepID=UPI0021D11DCD|nr:hypothetical protein [Roseibacterium sp. SDUM158016]MCU4654607.1 hypothetical protein [Roseibacterium sp. SDUM158016]